MRFSSLVSVSTIFLFCFVFFQSTASLSSGILTASRDCEAYSAKRDLSNPGNIRLELSREYPLQSRSGDWVRIRVEEAQPKTRWVQVDCGHISVAVAEKPSFRPFFDDEPVAGQDPAPPAPDLDAFDRAVLVLCGEWGSRPKSEDFVTMLLTVFPDEADTLAAALEYTILTRQDSQAGFVHELADVWFRENGFAHVFCGEPRSRTLGGLHFDGRYLQAQRAGWAGILNEVQCVKQEIQPPVYTVGAAYLRPDGSVGKACPKGYGLGERARDILRNGAQALKQVLPHSGVAKGNLACLADVVNAPFRHVFVARNRAVVTLYPDASPDPALAPCSG